MIGERPVPTEANVRTNYNKNLHIDESKIIQHVNIYVDNRPPVINGSHVGSFQDISDPEVGQEMQSSKSKGIVLTNSNLPVIREGLPRTFTSVLRKCPSGDNNAPSLNEKIVPFKGPHIELEEVQSSNLNISLSRLSKRDADKVSEKLRNISKMDSHEHRSLGSQNSQQGSFTPTN